MPAPQGNGTLVKVVVAVSLLLGSAAGTAVIAHESRIAVIEERSQGIQDDVAEIKADVKKLLGAR